MNKKFFLLIFLLMGVAYSLKSTATLLAYDLSADWSNTSNSDSTWAYGIRSASGSFSLFPVQTNSYINVGPPAFFGTQPAWANQTLTGNNGSPEGLAKSVGNSLFDFPLDRVGGHTPAILNDYLAIQWTAPQSGNVSLVGGAWMWRDINRHEGLSLFINNNAVFKDVPIPTRLSDINSTHLFSLSDAIVLAGGSPTQLDNIFLNAGDTIILASRGFDVEDFVGFDFTVKLSPSPVPLPGSYFLLLTGLLGLVSFNFIVHRFKLGRRF